ncbi:aldose 1-epimerase family protein [Pedobacter sp. LMG 31464]|uniref:Aldose 1-epimerase family protein n=1 Tax=Pedobacter planticolens TaxID=2679964 RepID=A0A923E119_9SPHI|nr:aldose 1-epimerase family protein [Pedobacter planticolens]MBB2146741.1 aldose 1-epimerase family protein [Pedobacter planticolens]
MIFIENEHIKVSFAAKGAELQSILGTNSLTEYMWSGDANYWGKFSPVLFPIVGALKDNTYQFEDKSYQLSRHGFARDMEFEYHHINEQEILFTLTHSDETLKVYPFEFKLSLRYKLSGASLSCTYEVTNPAEKELLFSIGGHPAFAVPLNKQGTYTDYFLSFNNDIELTYYHIVDNLISDKKSVLKLDEGKLTLQHNLFYDDALVIKNLKSDSISILNTKNYNGLAFNFKDFPYFGIWAAKDADFVCLEPWCGIADGINHNQQLKDKEGIVTLAAKQEWKRTWQVTCF